MKARKRILKIALLLIAVIFMNGFFFVFFWQHRATAKLDSRQRLNLYECCSAYTMHMALWIFGWPMSPAAAHECLLLHNPGTDRVVTIKSRRLTKSLLSPKVVNAIRSLDSKSIGSMVEVRWNGHVDYALASAERKAAIAVNPCTITKTEADGEVVYLLRCDMLYARHSDTRFNMGFMTIHLQEGLMRHLQDRGWLGRFMAEYSIPESYIPE